MRDHERKTLITDRHCKKKSVVLHRQPSFLQTVQKSRVVKKHYGNSYRVSKNVVEMKAKTKGRGGSRGEGWSH